MKMFSFAIIFVWEYILGKSKRFVANSTIELVIGLGKWLILKIKGNK